MNDSRMRQGAENRKGALVEKGRGGRESILNLPNQLTLARLVLSILFFVLLALEAHDVFSPARRAAVLNISMAVFILAVTTDFLDGYLARRMGLSSTFGRIADPFVDKIVICGGFIMLIKVSPLIEPWYAVLIVFREFLVSGLRSFLESRGVPFGAALSGKLKMVAQSITIPVLLFYEANFAPAVPGAAATGFGWLLYWVTVSLLVLTLLLTLVSCIGYVQRAVKLLRV
jgi:CDP-diacylglycerol--glycerol-3-phosphate 3-phosphatidyltransferase